jgi:hypothetical protein
MTESLTIATIGWTGSVLVVISLMQSNLRRLRVLSLVASVLHGVFNTVLGIGPGIALNIALVAINGYHLIAEHTPDRTLTVTLPGIWRLSRMAGRVRLARSQ